MGVLEDRVRETLARHAGSVAPRPMPPGTVAAVRRRSAAVAGVTAVVVLAAIVGLVAMLSVWPRTGEHRPAARDERSPLERVPLGWPAVEVTDPAAAPLSPHPTPVGAGPVTLVAGSVDGSPFALWAWARGEAAGRICLGLGGPAAVGASIPEPQRPGCARGGMPDADLAVFAASGDRPDLTAVFGIVHERVFEVWVSVADGGWYEVPLIHAALGRAEIRAFVAFPPSSDGAIEVYGPGGLEHGALLARATFCDATSTGWCRSTVSQFAPTASNPAEGVEPPAPGEWPDVVPGGNFEPYVDHELGPGGVLDPGVVTPKRPIIWGTVQGVPFSLTAFNVDGSGDWVGNGGPNGEPGPAGQLFLGSGGRHGGGGFALYRSTPWEPSDLGLRGFGFGAGPLTAYVGVVSQRVAAVDFRFEDGQVRSVEPVPGPPGVEAGYFLLWAPNDLGGEVVALAEDGSVLQSSTLCLPARDIEPNANVAC
jgi:hypothetical protein